MFPHLFNFGQKKKASPAAPIPFSGFSMGENTARDKGDGLLHCLLKGLFIFCASFGCISGVMSEFEIAYNIFSVFAVLFIVSMLLSLIHLRRWIFNVGYPLLFVVFTYSLLQLRAYVNSGFQALINIVNEEYSAHFRMLFTRESTEIITDRYLTVTFAIIFIGVFLAILLNVGIFNDMYFITTFNLTFWPLQLGIYIGKYPSFLSLGFLFFSYFAVYLIRHGGHYHFVLPGKNQRHTVSYKKRNKDYVFHKSNARNMAQLSFVALILTLFFSLFAAISIPRSRTEGAVSTGQIKQKADEYVQIFVRNGLSGFFNRYHSTGGISNGRLGGVSSVRPDYQTDLKVTFVPYAYETLYLRAFVGWKYTGSEWISPGKGNTATEYRYPVSKDSGVYTSLAPGSADFSSYHAYSAYCEADTLAKLMADGTVPRMSAKMIIENVDASPNHIYAPYYTVPSAGYGSVTSENLAIGVLLKGSSASFDYVPYSPSQADPEKYSAHSLAKYRNVEEKKYFAGYTAECYDNYLQIPEEIAPKLAAYHDEIALLAARHDKIDSDTAPMQQIADVCHFLTMNYDYSMSPGTTPRDADFVTYFLDTQKEGYCAHFASAAALLFRSYGIPARYVEGYVVTQSAVSGRAEATEYAYSDFFEGTNILDASSVVEVEVNDGDAHAWVEVFVDGFGWVPVEVTPPSDDDEQTTYADFLSALSGIFSTGENPNQNQTDGTGALYDNVFSSLHFQDSPAVIALLLLLLLLLLSPLLVSLCRLIGAGAALKKAYRCGRYDLCIAAEYKKLCKTLRPHARRASSHQPLFAPSPGYSRHLPCEVALQLKARLSREDIAGLCKACGAFLGSGDPLADLMTETENCCFSGKPVSKETADTLLLCYRRLRKLTARSKPGQTH